MSFIKKLCSDLFSQPVETLYRWQNGRFLWLLMAFAMGALVIVAHALLTRIHIEINLEE